MSWYIRPTNLEDGSFVVSGAHVTTNDFEYSMKGLDRLQTVLDKMKERIEFLKSSEAAAETRKFLEEKGYNLVD